MVDHFLSCSACLLLFDCLESGLSPHHFPGEGAGVGRAVWEATEGSVWRKDDPLSLEQQRPVGGPSLGVQRPACSPGSSEPSSVCLAEEWAPQTCCDYSRGRTRGLWTGVWTARVRHPWTHVVRPLKGWAQDRWYHVRKRPPGFVTLVAVGICPCQIQQGLDSLN